MAATSVATEQWSPTQWGSSQESQTAARQPRPTTPYSTYDNWLKWLDLIRPLPVRQTIRLQRPSDLEPLLIQFTRLPENWNSYGALPISFDVVHEAIQILRAATRFGLPKPGTVSPGGDGSIDLEWITGSTELHISVHPDATPTYLLILEGDSETEGELATTSQRASVLNQFSKSQSSPLETSQDPVTSDEILLRRFGTWQYSGGEKPNKSAFYNDRLEGVQTNRHSVSREKYTTAEQLQALAPDPDRFGVVAVVAQTYRDLDQQIIHSPTEEDYGHCDVVGNKTDRVRKRLREKAVIRLSPTLSGSLTTETQQSQ